MVSCSAYGCFNDSRKKIPGISFHRYPKNVVQRSRWVSRTNKVKFNPSATAALCSAHFEDNCFETMYKNKYLKPGSLPTIFPEHPNEVKKLIKAAKKKATQFRNRMENDDDIKELVDITESTFSSDEAVEETVESAASPAPLTTSPVPTDSPLKKNITSLKKSILQRVESKPLANNIDAMLPSKENTPHILIDATPSMNNFTPNSCGSNNHVNTLRISILKQNTPSIIKTEESFLSSGILMPHILIDATPCSSNSINSPSGCSTIKDVTSLRISIENSSTHKRIHDESTISCEKGARHIIIDASPLTLQSVGTTSPKISLIAAHGSKNVSDDNIEELLYSTTDSQSMRDASTSPIPLLIAQKPLTLKSEILSMKKYAHKYRQQISTLQQAKRRIQRRNEILENYIRKLKAS